MTCYRLQPHRGSLARDSFEEQNTNGNQRSAIPSRDGSHYQTSEQLKTFLGRLNQTNFSCYEFLLCIFLHELWLGRSEQGEASRCGQVQPTSAGADTPSDAVYPLPISKPTET